MLVSCSEQGSQSSQKAENQLTEDRGIESPLVMVAPDSELVDTEEIQSISLQSKKKAFLNLNDTNGKRVRFKYKFSTGQKIDFIVRDGEVSTGDMILSSYNELVKAIKKFEGEHI